MDRLDMCEAITLHKVPFVLNPTNEWGSLPPHLQEVIQQPWTEFKYFVGNNEINPEISNVPSNRGGIYLFLIKPNVIPEVHLYLAYIGRAKITEHRNLRKRLREYASEEERQKICLLKKYWSPYLYVRYLPLDDNTLIAELEKALIKVVLPPFNDQYPDVYNQPMRAAF